MYFYYGAYKENRLLFADNQYLSNDLTNSDFTGIKCFYLASLELWCKYCFKNGVNNNHIISLFSLLAFLTECNGISIHFCSNKRLPGLVITNMQPKRSIFMKSLWGRRLWEILPGFYWVLTLLSALDRLISRCYFFYLRHFMKYLLFFSQSLSYYSLEKNPSKWNCSIAILTVIVKLQNKSSLYIFTIMYFGFSKHWVTVKELNKTWSHLNSGKIFAWQHSSVRLGGSFC